MSTMLRWSSALAWRDAGRGLTLAIVGLVVLPTGVWGIDTSRPGEERIQAESVGALDVGEGPLQSSLARQRLRKAMVDNSRYVSEQGVVTAEQLSHFLAGKRSPMLPFTAEIIAAANRYRVDPRLTVAIAGVESNFGRVSKGFNAWGWNNGRTRWRSWQESIDVYTRSISENYPNWRDVHRIASTYNPNTPQSWARKVIHFMETMTRTA